MQGFGYIHLLCKSPPQQHGRSHTGHGKPRYRSSLLQCAIPCLDIPDAVDASNNSPESRHSAGVGAEFPARTVDYDADSDSVDEFPVDGFSEDDLQLVEEFVEDVTTSKGRPLEDDEDDTEGEPDLTSTSGDGPIVEFAGLPEWCVSHRHFIGFSEGQSGSCIISMASLRRQHQG